MPPGIKKTNLVRKPYDDDDDADDLVYDPETLPSILPPKVKKVKGPKVLPPPKLTKRSKSAARKIAKLEEEKAKKLKRGELYASLAATAIPEEHLRLLQRSGSSIGITTLTAKQQLQREADFKSAGLSFMPSGKSSSSTDYVSTSMEDEEEEESDDEKDEPEVKQRHNKVVEKKEDFVQQVRENMKGVSTTINSEGSSKRGDQGGHEQDVSKKRKRVTSVYDNVIENTKSSSLSSSLSSSASTKGQIGSKAHGKKFKGNGEAFQDDNEDDGTEEDEEEEEDDDDDEEEISTNSFSENVRKKPKKSVRWELDEDEDESGLNEEEEENDEDDDEEDGDEDEDDEDDDNEEEDDEDEGEEIRHAPMIIPPSKFSFSIKLPTSTKASVKSLSAKSLDEKPSSIDVPPVPLSNKNKNDEIFNNDNDNNDDEISRSVSSSAAAKRAAQPDVSELRLAELRARNVALSARGLTAASLLPKLRGGVTDDYASGDKVRRVARKVVEGGDMDTSENADQEEEEEEEEEDEEHDAVESLAEITAKAVAAARANGNGEDDDDDGPHVASATKNWWDPSSYVSASSTSEQQALSAAISAGVVDKGAFGLLTEEEVRDRITSNNDDLRSQLWMADGSKALDIHHKQALAAWSAYGRSSIRLKRDPRVQEARMELPVCRMEQEIMEALHSSDILILCGETGSGKTTQVPQFLLEAGYGCLSTEVKIASKNALSNSLSSSSSSSSSSSPSSHFYEGFPGLIGVTQPRRVAATSTADRVRSELSADPMLARSIAHQVRHDARSVNSSTKLKFMTDGILMREVQTDLLLRKYSVIVIDEAHERNVNTDVLIGILSRVIPLRNKIAKEEADALRARQGHINKESKDKEGVETGDSASRIPQPNDITAPLGPLKLIIMSATLRVDDFAANVKLFPSRPPVVKVDARQHPVTIHFAKQTAPDGDYVNEALKKACKVHSRLPEGGLLIFLSGSDEVEYLCGELRKKYGSKKSAALSAEKEIQETSQAAYDSAFAAAKAAGSDEEAAKAAGEEARVASKELVEKRQRKASGGSGGGLGPAFVLPLYALLPAAQQSRVFEPPPDDYRLVVVATNVAETSITIPGIRYVIDPGRRKRRVFDPRSGASRFEIGWISQAGAAQRAGRAGRTGPGHVYRLYSSALFANTFQEFDDPEILRTPVESLLLQLTKLGISQPSLFPFPSPPSQSALTAGRRTLLNLGALQVSPSLSSTGGAGGNGINSVEKLTALGEKIAEIPLSPHLAKMLIIAWMRQEAARKEGNTSNSAWNLLEYTLQIVAAMSAQPPFVLPSLKDDADSLLHSKGNASKKGGGGGGGAYRTDTVPNEGKNNKDDGDENDIDISIAGSDEEEEDDVNNYDDDSRMRKGRGVDTIAEKAAFEAGIDLKLLSPEDRAATLADITAKKQAEAEAAERRRLERVRIRTEAHRAHARMRHPLSDSLTLLRAMGAFNFAVHSAASAAKEMKLKKKEQNGEDVAVVSETQAASEFCKSQYLRLKSMKEALQLEKQLRRIFFSSIKSSSSLSSSSDVNNDKDEEKRGGDGDAAEDDDEEEKKQLSSSSPSNSSTPLLPPPSVQTETLLRQIVTSGLLERVAKRAPPELVESLCAAAQVGKGRAWVPYLPASEAVSCGFVGEDSISDASLGKVLFVHPSSAVDEADVKIMPTFLCFSEVVVSGRRQRAYMRGVTAVEESWLHSLSAGSPFCKLSAPLETPQPAYSLRADDTLCLRVPIFGDVPWRLTPVPLPLVLPRHAAALMGASASEESSIEARVTREAIRIRCFARALIDGTVIKQIKKEMLASPPIAITQNAPQKRVALLIDALTRGCSANGGKPIATLAGLREAWTPRKNKSEKGEGAVSRYLFPEIGAWIVSSEADAFLKLWPSIVKGVVDYVV